jgi:cell division protein FtsZ
MFYPDFDLVEAFKKPNEVLSMAVKSIAEIITIKGIINRDFNDVTSTMKDSGVALVSYGFGTGENRLDNAIQDALDSPLLNNNNIYSAKRILFYISFKKESHFKVEELTKSIDIFMGRFDNHIEMIWGFGVDETLGADQEVKFTIIATGFGLDAVPEIKEMRDENGLLRMQDDIKKQKENEERVERVYGENLNTNVKINRVSQSSIVVLTMEEMDDDSFISFIENHPTYNRNPKDIAAKRKPAKGTGPAEPVMPDDGNGAGGVTVIEF